MILCPFFLKPAKSSSSSLSLKTAIFWVFLAFFDEPKIGKYSWNGNDQRLMQILPSEVEGFCEEKSSSLLLLKIAIFEFFLALVLDEPKIQSKD